MGGYGSGRRPSFGVLVDKCEDFQRIDLAWLRRQGALKIGYAGSIQWSRAGKVTSSIRYRVEEDGLRLIYRTRRHGGKCRPVKWTNLSAVRAGARESWGLTNARRTLTEPARVVSRVRRGPPA